MERLKLRPAVRNKLLTARRIACGSLGIALLCVTGFLYRSDYLYVKADKGRKTVGEYASLMGAAAETNDNAALRMADYLQATGQYDAALGFLQRAETAKDHWKGWEMLGIIREKIAFSAMGSTDDAVMAAEAYNRMLQVYPTYRRGLERKGLLALKRGNWKDAEDVADSLQEHHSVLLDASYLRAKAAEGRGETTKALILLQRISAEAGTSSSLYSIKQIREDIHILSGQKST